MSITKVTTSNQDYLQVDIITTQGDNLISDWFALLDENAQPTNLTNYTIKYSVKADTQSVYTDVTMPYLKGSGITVNSGSSTIDGVVYAPNTIFRLDVDKAQMGADKYPIPKYGESANYLLDVEMITPSNQRITMMKGTLTVTYQITL